MLIFYKAPIQTPFLKIFNYKILTKFSSLVYRFQMFICYRIVMFFLLALWSGTQLRLCCCAQNMTSMVSFRYQGKSSNNISFIQISTIFDQILILIHQQLPGNPPHGDRNQILMLLFVCLFDLFVCLIVCLLFFIISHV